MLKKYRTNVDGRGYVKGDVELEKNDLVMIDDDIYNVDREVFKVTDVRGNKVEMKYQKVLDLSTEMEGNKEAYVVEGYDGIYYAANRLNKNQMILVGKDVCVVKEIEKRKGEPSIVKVEKQKVKWVKSYYVIYFREHGGSEEKPYKECDSYGEALLELWRLRSTEGHRGYFRFR